MINIILLVIIASIAVAIIYYLLRANKRGQKCVGCPYSQQCSKKCDCHSKPKGDEKS